MLVSDRMSRTVHMAHVDDTIQDVARVMADHDIGALPVANGDDLVGIVTDRDITIRAVSAGKGPNTPVQHVMTPQVKYCFEYEDVELVAGNMGDQQIRRLPVVNRDKRLVGILALFDVASEGSILHAAADALAGVSRPVGGRNE